VSDRSDPQPTKASGAGVSIDVNADLGETAEPDPRTEDIIRHISSANIACGYHAGNERVMRATAEVAHALGVAIGAHISYLDPTGFGRRPVDVPPDVLRSHLEAQVDSLARVADALGAQVGYVKPHGALYHRAATDEATARVVAEVVASLPQRNGAAAVVVAPPHSVVAAHAAERGVTCIAEAFPDRAYLPDGSLVDRSVPGSVLTDAVEIARRAVSLAVRRSVERADGRGPVSVDAQSLCLHGDGPAAVAAARAVRLALDVAGVTVRPFAVPRPRS
jgi:UPF0271 protein